MSQAKKKEGETTPLISYPFLKADIVDEEAHLLDAPSRAPQTSPIP